MAWPSRNHLIAAALLAGCASAPTGQPTPGPTPFASALAQPTQPAPQGSPPLTPPPTFPAPPTLTASPPSLGALIVTSSDLRDGPVREPMELIIPALAVRAPVLGVGITLQNVMDAPKGPIDDVIWQTAFWYRGSGVPGDSGTATLAGHVDDPLGRPGVFARLQDLRPGDLIVIHATRSGLDLHFTVAANQTLSVRQAADPAVLAQIYGAGPVAGLGPKPAADGLAHLTLITCIGDIVNGAFDHHVVVYATRSS